LFFRFDKDTTISLNSNMMWRRAATGGWKSSRLPVIPMVIPTSESGKKTLKSSKKLEKVGRKAYLCKEKSYNYDHEGSIDSPD
jgi:hypothetical protein